MQKIGLLFLILMMSVIAQSRADDQIHLDADIKTQIRVPTPVKIKKVIDATTLLSDDGKIYSLTGIDIPNDNDTALKTQKRLIELTEGKKCAIIETRNEKVGRINRMNQILGHLTCGADDIWIQGTLLFEGLARVRTTPENNQQATRILLLESTARAKNLGLWALPMNKPLTINTAKATINSFQVVEGKIYSVSQNKDSLFLNFTSDWKTDFSIGVPAKLRRSFSKQRIELMSLKGQTIRVRGWMRDYNGPYIELDHAEQLEIISSHCHPEPCDNGVKDLPFNKGDSSPTAQNDNRSTGGKQFMHTIGGPTAPAIEKPAPPSVEKKKDGKTD